MQSQDTNYAVVMTYRTDTNPDSIANELVMVHERTPEMRLPFGDEFVTIPAGCTVSLNGTTFSGTDEDAVIERSFAVIREFIAACKASGSGRFSSVPMMVS